MVIAEKGSPCFFLRTSRESRAIDVMDSFIEKLWQEKRAPAKAYLEEHDLPLTLSHAADGVCRDAVSLEEMMADFIKYLSRAFDDATNMDW